MRQGLSQSLKLELITNKKYTIMNLLEKIDDLRAKSVTPERFEKVWGVTIEEHMKQLMTIIDEIDKASEKEA